MLTDVLKLHFGWHLARIKCLAYLIVALFSAGLWPRTVDNRYALGFWRNLIEEAA